MNIAQPSSPSGLSGRSPYTPTFGSQPSKLAGRDEVIEDLIGGLLAGPADSGFGRMLIGERGMGKTVLLDAVGKRMRDEGWLQVDVQIRDRQDPLVGLFMAVKDEAERATGDAKLKSLWGGLEKELTFSAGIPMVVQVSASVRSSGRGEAEGDPVGMLDRLLHSVGRRAKSAGKGMLITLDEMQIIAPEDLQSIGASFQLVAKRHGLPIGVLAAGLPVLPELLAGCHATFFERLEVADIGPLGHDSARVALLEPAMSRGVALEPEAVDELVRRSGGYPYLVQLYGWAAWHVAGDESPGGTTITVAHARNCGELVRSKYENLVSQRWATFSTMEQRYLVAMGELGEGQDVSVDSVAVAERLGKTVQEVSYLRDALINKHHIIRANGMGKVAPVLPGVLAWGMEHGDHDLSAPVKPGRRPKSRPHTFPSDH